MRLGKNVQKNDGIQLSQSIAVLNCELVKRLIAVLMLRVKYVEGKMGCFREIQKQDALSSL